MAGGSSEHATGTIATLDDFPATAGFAVNAALGVIARGVPGSTGILCSNMQTHAQRLPTPQAFTDNMISNKRTLTT